MKDEGIQYPERKGVFFVKKDPDEQAIDSRIAHLCQLQKSCT